MKTRQIITAAALLALGLSDAQVRAATANAERHPGAGPAVPGVGDAAGAAVLPPVIGQMLARGRGVTIVDRFPVPGVDLTGWVLAAGADQRIYYVTADGQHAILGLLFDGELNNLTARQGARYPLRIGAAPVSAAGASQVARVAPFDSDAAVAAALARARQGDAALVEGEGADLYVLYDPACPYCHQLWRDLRGALGRVRVHWLPVARVSSRSAGLAQALLEAPDRGAAMARAAAKELVPAAQVSQATTAILARNAQILDVAGKKNVPLILFSEHGSAAAFLGLPGAPALSKIIGEAEANGQPLR